MPDVHAALREAARVLKKPGGRFLFIEHVLASEERRLLRLQQRLLDPLQVSEQPLLATRIRCLPSSRHGSYAGALP